MLKTLHILNGDATQQIFGQTNIKGDVAVMRETFCMWPISKSFDKAFWESRKTRFKTYYWASEADYDKQVLLDLEKVKQPYHEIIIWYEYDVYCQINMLFLIKWITQHSSAQIKLVYSSVALGTLSQSDYSRLYAQSQLIDDLTIQQGQLVWNAMADQNVEKLDSLTKFGFRQLRGLPNALRNYSAQVIGDPKFRPIQLRIMGVIQSGISNGKNIIEQLISIDHIYGYGDLQYMIILVSMEDELEFDQLESNNLKDFMDGVFGCLFRIKSMYRVE